MASFAAPLAVVILAGTVVLIAWRPLGLREGLAATLGASLMIVAGLAGLADVGQAARDTAGIMVFLVGMMIVATVADEAGFFEWVAAGAIRSAKGRGRLLYVYLYLLGAMITLFLSLDVTAIIFTPIVCALALRLRLKPLPFVLSSAFVANSASLVLPVSNLTNMLVYDLLGIDFWAFVRHLVLPNLVALGINLGVFLLLFRKQIPRLYSMEKQAEPEVNQQFRVVAGLGLGLVVVGLLIAGFAGWPLWTVAVLGAVGLSGIGLWWGQIDVGTLRRGIAWQLPFFVVGMYVVVAAVNRVALSALWTDLLSTCQAHQGVGALVLAFGTGAGANLVNNLPMSLVAIGALKTLGAGHDVLSFAALIGTNLGPNVTVFGSLATMLILQSARRRGIQVSAGEYLRIGVLTTPPMILAATLVLVVNAPA